ncbi:hypothetical protein WAF17_18520 [Bernardetia sp. ABR2-2B]|uniref:hypothetical protein n=1 Tax=Bernardetia sp. ABR2-2B TaxID=3127472 RepID=UPI0030CF74B4
MKTTYFITLLFFFLSFCTFASESDSKPSIQEKTVTNSVILEKSKATSTKKQKKLNFKERLALKLVKKKIKKAQKKQAKTKKVKKNKSIANAVGTILISVLFILLGVIGGIIAFAMGEVLLGILLLLLGLIAVPIILVIALIG